MLRIMVPVAVAFEMNQGPAKLDRLKMHENEDQPSINKRQKVESTEDNAKETTKDNTVLAE